LQKSYEDRPDRWNKPETARVVQLLISTRDLGTGQEFSEEAKKEKLKTVQGLRERIGKGEDIGALAKQFSDDGASKARGGEIAFARGRMVLEFEAATFSMEPGQLSDVVTTQYGYHLIKLLAKTSASRRPLEEVQAAIREELVAKELAKQLPDYSAQIRKAAGVELTAAAPKAPALAPATEPAPGR
jgi:peptidyl-prolyl cis-trans isomerase C